MSLFEGHSSGRRLVTPLAIGLLLAIAIVAAFVIGGALRHRMASPPATVERPAPGPVPPPVVEREDETPEPEPSPRATARPAPKPVAPPAPAPPTAGTLHIESDVAGASVFIDRVYVGTTPLTVGDIAIGGHRLNVSAQGYEGYAETIDVEPGPRDLTVRFKVVRLDATLAVVHKHRFGSCQGQLIATPSGLRYETTDKGDRFSTSLSDLDSFEVDYLKKNLRIKPRRSRTYNFTDPDGNADRLFVFHRDVEKAREQLARGFTLAK